MATRDTRENYRAYMKTYMREYYKKHSITKKAKLLNQINVIKKVVYNDEEKTKILSGLNKLEDIINLPKYNYEAPDDITDFLNEDVSYSFNNSDNKINQ